MDNCTKYFTYAGLEKLFSRETGFLHHEDQGASFEVEELISILKDGVSDQKSLNILAAFSNRLHEIPRRGISQSGGVHSLWKIYRHILRFAQIAQPKGELDISIGEIPNEIKEFEKAYRDYEARHKGLLGKYQDEKRQLLRASSWDDTSISQWQDRLANSEREWIIKGYKIEVDRYYFNLMMDKGRHFDIIWKKWNESFLDDLHIRSDMNGGQYISFDVTYNLNNLNWSLFESDQIEALQGSLPKELHNIYFTEDVSWVEKVSFEYAKVSVSRAWFEPLLFTAKFWKIDSKNWPYTQNSVSEFGDGDEGLCPAYISDFVLVRKAKVVYKKSFPERIVHEIETGVEMIGRPADWFISLFSKERKSFKIEDAKMYLMSYCCQIIPISPNPDSSLNW